MKEKKRIQNKRGELQVILSPVLIREDLFEYLKRQSESRKLSMKSVITECIENHRKQNES